MDKFIVRIKRLYFEWGMAHIALFLCMILLTFFSVRAVQPIALEAVILLFGIVTLTISVKKRAIGGREGPVDAKTVQSFFLLILMAAIMASGLWWYVLTQENTDKKSMYINVLVIIAKTVCLIFFGTGTYGLFKGRTADYHWLSIYIICITLLFVYSTFFAVLYNMDPDMYSHMMNDRLTIGAGALAGVIGLCDAIWLLFRKKTP